MVKLVALAGYFGGLRGCKLVDLTWECITFTRDGILLYIAKSKTDRAAIGATKLLPKLADTAICPFFYFSKYKEQCNPPSGRLFRKFQNGKFIKTPIGKNSIATMPKEIATFLELEDADSYTGHAFRVTSATALADSGATTICLKRHGRWSSESVAEEYIRESKQVRADTANMLAESALTLHTEEKRKAKSNISFNNCVFNCQVNFIKNESELEKEE